MQQVDLIGLFRIPDMRDEAKDFLAVIGDRIAARRKELGLTQIDLADRIGASQKIITSYERATCQIPVWRLPVLADALGMSVEELLGTEKPQRGRGRESRLEQQLDKVKQLPRSEQQFVIKMLDNALAHAG